MSNDWEGFPKYAPMERDIIMRKNSDGVYVMPARLLGMIRVEIKLSDLYQVRWVDEQWIMDYVK